MGVTRHSWAAALAAVALLLPGGAQAIEPAPTVLGPVFPMPGGPGAGHGGSTCYSSVENGNMGTGAGQTWNYGGGSDPAVAGCPYSATPTAVPEFDPSRFQTLFWGMSTDSPPRMWLNISSATDLMHLSTSPGDTDLAQGVVVWTTTTKMTGCVPASCGSGETTYTDIPVRLVMTVQDFAGNPVPLVSPSTVGLDPEVGGLVQVTDTLKNYKVNLLMTAQNPVTSAWQPALTMYNSFNHISGIGTATFMSFGGAFYYTSKVPTGSITGAANPEKGVATTYTADAVDPDGDTAALTYAWDLDNDGAFDDAATQSVTPTFSTLGARTLGVRVTDADGATTDLTRVVTAVDTTAPRATLKLSATGLGTVLRKGVGGKVTSNEKSSANLKATIPKKLAEKLGIPTIVARGKVPVTAGTPAPFLLPLTDAAKAKLATLSKVPITVTAVVSDPSRNKTILKQTRTYEQ